MKELQAEDDGRAPRIEQIKAGGTAAAAPEAEAAPRRRCRPLPDLRDLHTPDTGPSVDRGPSLS